MFLLAGHDTTAGALTFTLHLLSLHSDIEVLGRPMPAGSAVLASPWDTTGTPIPDPPRNGTTPNGSSAIAIATGAGSPRG